MRKYKERFLWRKIFYSNFTIVFICVLIFFSTQGVLRLYKKYNLTKKDYAFIYKEEVDVGDKLLANQYKLANINTKEGKEKYLRETYPVKKQGENLVIVYNSPSSTYEIPKSQSSWEFFKKFLKDLLGL